MTYSLEEIRALVVRYEEFPCSCCWRPVAEYHLYGGKLPIISPCKCEYSKWYGAYAFEGSVADRLNELEVTRI